MSLARQTALAAAAVAVIAAALITSFQDPEPLDPIFAPVLGDPNQARSRQLPRPIDPAPTGIEGQPFARLEIPSLGVDIMVVEGTSGEAMRAGAGHYEHSSDPGKGNVAIAGHRTGYGGPFRNLDRLRAGDTAILTSGGRRFTYAIGPPFDGHGNPWITHPLDWTPIAPTSTPSLTLTTADPPHTSENRLIVRFRLIRSD